MSAFASIAKGQKVWSRLRRERGIAVAESRNAPQLVEAGNLGAGMGKAACQVCMYDAVVEMCSITLLYSFFLVCLRYHRISPANTQYF